MTQIDKQTSESALNDTNTSTLSSRSADACNLTLVLHEKHKMSLEQRPLPPKPKANEVQLATHTVGICGSDVKYWQAGKIGRFVLTKPMILGHETSAVVVEAGAGVKALKVGDRVAVEVGVPCANCSLCKRGKYNLCALMAFAATPPFDGTLTRYFNHPADFCFKLPASVSLEEGALLEPLAVAVHACRRAPIKLGDIVLVTGAGAVGLLCMLTARAFGASKVIVTDVQAARLEFAKSIGADETFLVDKTTTPESIAAKVRQFCTRIRNSNDTENKSSDDNDNDDDGDDDALGGVDVALECSGAESSIAAAIRSTSVGATVVCVGCQQDSVQVPLNLAMMQEVDVKGVFRYRNCYPLALSLVEAGKINLKPLISHKFKLEQAVDAFEACSRGEGIKILIQCSDETGSKQPTP